MDKLELKALGKINLGLDILGRRENGYHDVRMVMQTVYLYDRVTLEKTREPGIEISTNLSYLPVNENNIAYKAAELLRGEFGIREGIRITLEKHIPVAAGMAGGSSNAAAVLFGMNRMFGLGLSEEGLKERGVTLGADVPYCIMRGTVLAEGIGEILTPLPPLPKCYVLIAKPPLSASTRTVYEKIDREGIKSHPDIDGILAGLQEGDLQQVAGSMGNVLEQVMLEEHPVLQRIKDVMIGAGALNAMMSGSGPTVFGIFTSRGRARAAAARLKRQTPVKQAYVTNVHNVRRK
ncbi:4-(cytidine 5'-diphospho)-2-C-methyl-D-erythritol kinase [Faecalicatena contorta]|uniref:4-(cytidine 5'-diphospho)-2-C-methyl-D-erythritol kinase n=1 Tax=Clostridia TaxID=186801 RepID=UPI00051AD1FB|nr:MULTISPECIES: 4-(cytidine 5'-diphospho)-2-C-methyl-D-erythritol kinase [Clostridia]MBM6685803.1 4-(cytidine 5'-diphospho)-2-C-methyl-D-erythritol kinase [Faecalicatena contorta]MBM6711393.1 4-(cytidine 5'-diphospho)-2-C-methyl-D-erythritol kinase [Faecalicatena contorta]HIY00204.1 4-(cytidine 5'-diphospho)-2-C-methyl-D-erythritol kinase [Candidatus Dorea intestinigallinarum]